MRSKYMKKVGSLLETSSWHALPNMVRSEYFFMKIFWLICFCLAFSYCSYVIVLGVLDYLAFRVLQNVELVSDYESEFPAITICNLNSMDLSSQSTRNAFDSYLLNQASLNGSYLSKQATNATLNPGFCKKSIADAIRRIPGFNGYGFTLDKMYMSCTYDNKPCSINDFKVYNDSLFGTCVRFNTGKNRSNHDVPIKLLQRPDITNAFRLELFVGAPEYHPCWSSQAGALVVVHNKSEAPLHSKDGVKVPVGFESNFLVRKTVVQRQSAPYSDCIVDLTDPYAYDSALYTQTVKKYGLYLQKWCIQNCATDSLNADNAILCANYTNATSPTYIECYANQVNLSNYYKDCLQYCPAACDTYSFGFSHGSSQYPSLAYAEYLMNQTWFTSKYPYENPSYDQIRNSILAINIYFPVLEYTLITEIPAVTIATLLGKLQAISRVKKPACKSLIVSFLLFAANLGGQLGLFLGCSILSFVEIAEIILELVFIKFDTKIAGQVDLVNQNKFGETHFA